MTRTLIILALLSSVLTYGQNEEDILRASFHNSFSTARSAGMGGAFGALGADLSALNSNPAGLGLYRRSDFNLTPNLGGSSSKTTFNNQTESKGDVHFKLNTLGFAVTQDSKKINVNKVVFAISVNQLANFNTQFRLKGENENSLLDVFADDAEGTDYFDIQDASIRSQLAYDAFLIDTLNGSSNQYNTAIPFDGSNHDILVQRKGGISELSFGGAANISDRLYWGVAIGIPFLNFSEKITHKESASNTSLPLDRFTYNESLDVSGVGINLKMGVILKPSQKLRIGAAVHTPTAYSVNDNYSRGISAEFKDETITPDDFVGTYDYRIKTPLKLMVNGAFIAGKSGIISADYEYRDYSTGMLKMSSLSGDNYDFAAENAETRESYRETHNVKAGVEIRIAKKYRVRAGTRYTQSPYTKGELSDNVSGPIISYTGGFGFRDGDFYLDIAAIYTERSDSYYAYGSSYIDEAQTTNGRLNLLTTIGWRF